MALFTYKGIDIDVNNSGNFVAVVDEIAHQKPTLIELQGALDRELKAKSTKVSVSLPITGIVRKGTGYLPAYTSARGTITGINRTTGTLLIDSTAGKDGVWDYVFVDTEENRKLALDCAEALNHASHLRREAEGRKVKTNSYGTRISHEEYIGQIEKLRFSYDTQKRKGEEVIAQEK